MSESPSAITLVMKPDDVFELALRSEGWSAARRNDGQVYRLAGGSIDLRPGFVTDVRLSPGDLHLETAIPIYIPAERRDEAVRLCSVLHSNNGVFSLGKSGAPLLLSKTMLFLPETYAVSVIVDAVRRDRDLVKTLLGLFHDVAQGRSAASAASRFDLDDYLPAGRPMPTAAQLDLSLTPEPSAEQLAETRALRVGEAEAVALARRQALIEAIFHRDPDRPPLCAGPLIFHEDGVVECHYCDTPETRIHGGGCSASCRRHRQLGKGHYCPRCAP